MTEINEKDLEKAAGGISSDLAIHFPYDSCEQYEPDPNIVPAPEYSYCKGCAHARYEGSQYRCLLGAERKKEYIKPR